MGVLKLTPEKLAFEEGGKEPGSWSQALEALVTADSIPLQIRSIQEQEYEDVGRSLRSQSPRICSRRYSLAYA